MTIPLTRGIKTRSHGQVFVVSDAESLAHTAADWFVQTTNAAISARGRASVALAGGSTPRRMGELLAGESYRNRIAWDHLDIFWGDERWVPLTSPESNAGVALRTFLTQVPVPAANIHPFPVAASESERHEGATPGLAATRYEHLLRRLLNTETEVPTVDLVLLGMGDDGHTASLFPHTEALREQRALVVANPVPKLNAVRLTLTFPILNAARDLFVLVSGRGKAETLAAVLDGPERGDDLPIQLIRPHPGDLTWLVDEAAASHLHHLEATDE